MPTRQNPTLGWIDYTPPSLLLLGDFYSRFTTDCSTPTDLFVFSYVWSLVLYISRPSSRLMITKLDLLSDSPMVVASPLDANLCSRSSRNWAWNGRRRAWTNQANYYSSLPLLSVVYSCISFIGFFPLSLSPLCFSFLLRVVAALLLPSVFSDAFMSAFA